MPVRGLAPKIHAMYTSPDDARSDLFLSGAVFLFGPTAIRILLDLVPLNRVALLGELISVAVPLVVTVLVPLLLMRYRRESVRSFGFGASVGGAGFGVLLALPIVAAGVLVSVFQGVPPHFAFPVTALDHPAAAWDLLARVAGWLGLVGLGVYGTYKARDAFRSDYQTVAEGLSRIGLIVMAVAGGATVLYIIGLLAPGGVRVADLLLVLFPLGVGGALLLAHRSLRGPSVTSRAVLLTPTVIFALGPFALSLHGLTFVTHLYLASLHAGIGLAVAALVEGRRQAWAAMALGLTLALFSPLSPLTRL